MPKTSRKAEWDKVAKWWEELTGETGNMHQRLDIDPVVLRLLGNLKNKKVLEIGCGNGYFARLLARKGAKVTAADLSKKLINLALRKEKEKPLGIKYLVRDAAKLTGVKSNSFDIVVANMCLMDIADANRAIREASRVLKKNGRFIFSITHPAFADYRQKWLPVKEGSKKYFARVLTTYLSLSAKKVKMWTAKAKVTQYHRSVDAYANYLKKAGFLIGDFKEVATKKKVTKAEREDDVRFIRSKYKIPSEKRMKEVAGKEFPLFLIVGAVKA